MGTPGRQTPALRLLALLAVLCLAVPAVAQGRLASGVDADLGAAVAARINAVRAGDRLPRLRVQAQLARAARQHALSMVRLGYFSHTSADGTSPTRRITSYYRVGGASSWAVGEILLWHTGNLTAGQAVAAWLRSSVHRSLLLGRQWREVGIAAVHEPHAPGVYGGRDVTLVVVDFGRR